MDSSEKLEVNYEISLNLQTVIDKPQDRTLEQFANGEIQATKDLIMTTLGQIPTVKVQVKNTTTGEVVTAESFPGS